MNVLIKALILALSVSADALACGFGAGVGRLKIPVVSAMAAAAVSAGVVAIGMSAGNLISPYVPSAVGKYISFAVLAVLGLIKLASADGDAPVCDCNYDKILSVGEGVALGSALSVDGLAAGFGYVISPIGTVCATAFTFAFTVGALCLGARGGSEMKEGRLGNIAAGLTLVFLAVQKLLTG